MSRILPESEGLDLQEPGPEESVPELTSHTILQFPWILWRDLKGSDAFLRRNLNHSLFYAFLLRFFRTNLKNEIAKKRSRKGAAVRRAFRYSKTDARKLVDSIDGLDLEILWNIFDKRLIDHSKSLKNRLEEFLSKNVDKIIKFEPEENPNYDEEFESDSDLEVEESTESMSDQDSTLSQEDGKPIEESEKLNGGLNDKFFKLEEMEAFADQEVEDEEEIDYFESLGEESDDSVAAADMKYSDFFRDPDENLGESEEDLKPLRSESNLEALDEYEREMELTLQKLEKENMEEDDEEEGEYRDEIEDEFEFEEEADQEEEKAIGEEDLKISQIENELVKPKHWSLMGETTAKDRPRNSLLDLDLELPQTSSVVYERQEGELEQTAPQQDQLPLEIIITQRIKSGVFDNVERKTFEEDQIEATEKLKKNKEQVEIDFNKNEMGLGEVYAQKYREQFMALDKMDAHKRELTEQFAKLVYKLDALSNSTFVPKRVSQSEKDNTVPTISVETPINVVISEHPNEKHPLKPEKVSRTSKKRKFKNKMKALIKRGRLTPEEVKKIKDKMTEKNRSKREDAKSKRETGLTARETMRHEMNSNRKINTAELLSTIASS